MFVLKNIYRLDKVAVGKLFIVFLVFYGCFGLLFALIYSFCTCPLFYLEKQLKKVKGG